MKIVKEDRYVFADDMISYLENPKDSKITKTLRINSAKLQNTTIHANQLKIPFYNSNE